MKQFAPFLTPLGPSILFFTAVQLELEPWSALPSKVILIHFSIVPRRVSSTLKSYKSDREWPYKVTVICHF